MNKLSINNVEDFIDYLIENASIAFEHQDRDMLTDVIKQYKRFKGGNEQC